MTAGRTAVWYRGLQIEKRGGRLQEERTMEGQDTEDGIDISITDEINSDLDLIAGTQKGKDYIEQEGGA
jgi:hypothetical protein